MMPLSQLEVFDLASNLAERIQDLLNGLWYNRTGTTLSIQWSTKQSIDAWAAVEPSLENPSRHVIVLTYELVSQIYSEALDFSMFALGSPGQTHHLGIHTIPKRFGMLEAAEFMFEAGITFVIFHELSHINQFHGSIRAKYAPSTSQATIHEFAIDGAQPLTGAQACIYHATEFAADYEALDWMATCLEVQFSGQDFYDHAYLQCAIVSCIMLMFNGDRPMRIDSEPIGSHPYPVPRMDFWVKAYSERLYALSQHLGIEDSKPEIAKRLTDASFLTLLKWMTRFQLPNSPSYSDFCKGSMAHPNCDSYMRHVINLWSLEYPQARASRKFGGALSVLYFTDEFRDKIRAVKNHETLKEHLQQCLSVVQEEDRRLSRSNIF